MCLSRAGPLWLVVLHLSACTSTSTQEPERACFIDYEPEPEPAPLYPEPTECDPRVAPVRSPRIQPPVLIGEHANGTVYVVDRLDGGYNWRENLEGRALDPRLFISAGNRLIQRDGSGGGHSSFIYEWGSFGTRDGSVRGDYRLDRNRDPKHMDPADAKMVLRESELQHTLDELQSEGLSVDEAMAQLLGEQTPLRVRAECAVKEFEIEFTTGRQRVINYVAEDERGYHILVTGPPRQFDGYDFEVFYGPPDRVVEYPTAGPIGRERDGGTTTILFKIDDEPAELYFPVNTITGGDRKPRITLPDQELGVTLFSEITPGQALPEGMTYVCHDQEY